MPNPTEGGKDPLDKPRSPHSSSTESSQRSSLRAYHPEKDTEPVSTSTRIRLTRKRAASLDMDSANEPSIAGLALDSAGRNEPNSSAGLSKEQICLCQPDPKIPRPRNAFILYRQHTQSQVVAAHPGLANPEISKIIGEQWKNQTPEVKLTWKQLAEEEKQRHSRQYPGYRYQPRRAGKTSSIHPNSASPENAPTRCPKCNGRYISTPITPFTPGFAVQGRRPERAPLPFTPSRLSDLERLRYPTEMQPSRMSSPGMPMQSQQMPGKRAQYASPQHMPIHHLEREDEMELLSPMPEQKRRRFNDGRRYSVSSPTQYSQPQQQFTRVGGGLGAPPMSAGYRPAQSPMPGPNNMMNRPTQSVVPHAMGLTQPAPRHPYTTRSSTHFDESLRLPPLQTQPHASTSSSRLRSMDAREIRARSVEAMVMTIPYINKIKILHRISPPLAHPGPTSPAHDIRGVVVAVEGFDKELLKEVGSFVEETLRGNVNFEIKSWETAHGRGNNGRMGSIEEVTSDGATPEIDAEGGNPFVEYLSIISSMHLKSHEICKHITTRPDSPQPHRMPVAILPFGFSLTTSDAYALRIPINDSYAPIDHWQWMATLWRGIIGPDLTIYVARVGREEMGTCGSVEVRGELGGIVVRVLDEAEGGIDEKTRRRLGFEVLEYVRSSSDGGWGRS